MTENNKGIFYLWSVGNPAPPYSESITKIVNYLNANLSQKPIDHAASLAGSVAQVAVVGRGIQVSGYIQTDGTYTIPINDGGASTYFPPLLPENTWTLVRIINSTFDGTTRVITTETVNSNYKSGDTISSTGISPDVTDENSLLIMQLTTLPAIYRNIVYLPNIDFFDAIITDIEAGTTISDAVSAVYSSSTYYITTYTGTDTIINIPKSTDGVSTIFENGKTWQIQRILGAKRDIYDNYYYTLVDNVAPNYSQFGLLFPISNLSGFILDTNFVTPGPQADNNSGIFFHNVSSGINVLESLIGPDKPEKAYTTLSNYLQSNTNAGVIQTNSIIPSAINFPNSGLWAVNFMVGSTSNGAGSFEIVESPQTPMSFNNRIFRTGIDLSTLLGFDPYTLYFCIPYQTRGFFYAESQEIVNTILAFLGNTNTLSDLWLNTSIPNTQYAYIRNSVNIPDNPQQAQNQANAFGFDISGNPQLFSNTSWDTVALKLTKNSTVYNLPSGNLTKPAGYVLSSEQVSLAYDTEISNFFLGAEATPEYPESLVFFVPTPQPEGSSTTTTTSPPDGSSTTTTSPPDGSSTTTTQPVGSTTTTQPVGSTTTTTTQPVGSTTTTTTTRPPCFLAGAIVETDQGPLRIETINPAINTINGKRIVAITKNNPPSAKMVRLYKDIISPNVPNRHTDITHSHNVLYDGEFICASMVPGLRYRPYKGETLYNVLMEAHETMIVNNMRTKTLPPDHPAALEYIKNPT